jgi:hypothetical protein
MIEPKISNKLAPRAEHPTDEHYPVSEFYDVKDGWTIRKTDRKWDAILVAEADGELYLRYYGWEKRKGLWKVALRRFDISDWDIDEVAKKVKELKKKWGIKEDPKAVERAQKRERRDLKDFVRTEQQSEDSEE